MCVFVYVYVHMKIFYSICFPIWVGMVSNLIGLGLVYVQVCFCLRECVLDIGWKSNICERVFISLWILWVSSSL